MRTNLVGTPPVTNENQYLMSHEKREETKSLIDRMRAEAEIHQTVYDDDRRRKALFFEAANTLSALRILAQGWRMQNGDYPESKDDCADELLAVIEKTPTHD